MSTRPREDASSSCQGLTACSVQQAYASWITTLAPWLLYLTLTYDPKRPAQHECAPSHWASSRHLARWHSQATGILGRPTYVAAALEHARNGWPHWHGLLACGAIAPAEFAALSRSWFSARGACYFSRIQAGTQPAVAAYVSKYLVKESGQIALLGPWQTRRAVLQATF
jgi:hypothetical protein